MSRPLAWTLTVGLALAAGAPAMSADLYRQGDWPALASDRLAQRVGDSLTVLIDESAVASNSTLNGTKKSSHVGGEIQGGSFDKTGKLALDSHFDGSGQTGRSDKIVAQVSVVVDSLLPNGDLHVSGAQALQINGEHTNIHVSGRVRRADIASNNTVPSTRLADASINYDGAGFSTKGAKPGVLTKVLNFVGIP
jgi:flagellar L-ring protein precursor FlgH